MELKLTPEGNYDLTGSQWKTLRKEITSGVLLPLLIAASVRGYQRAQERLVAADSIEEIRTLQGAARHDAEWIQFLQGLAKAATVTSPFNYLSSRGILIPEEDDDE